MLVFAIGFAVLLGWAISQGIAGHMEKEPEGSVPLTVGSGGSGLASFADACLDELAKIPETYATADGPVALRTSVALLYAGKALEDATSLDQVAPLIDSLGLPGAATCLRKRADEIRRSLPAVFESESVSTAAKGIMFPDSEAA